MCVWLKGMKKCFVKLWFCEIMLKATNKLRQKQSDEISKFNKKVQVEVEYDENLAVPISWDDIIWCEVYSMALIGSDV